MCCCCFADRICKSCSSGMPEQGKSHFLLLSENSIIIAAVVILLIEQLLKCSSCYFSWYYCHFAFLKQCKDTRFQPRIEKVVFMEVI